MKKIILFLFVSFSFEAIAQEKKDSQNISITSSTEPIYPKGEQAFYDFILKNIVYSDEAKNKKIDAEIGVSFWVNPDSTTSSIKIISSVGLGIDEEVIRLISLTKFSPGTLNGKPSKMKMIMDIPVRAH